MIEAQMKPLLVGYLNPEKHHFEAMQPKRQLFKKPRKQLSSRKRRLPTQQDGKRSKRRLNVEKTDIKNDNTFLNVSNQSPYFKRNVVSGWSMNKKQSSNRCRPAACSLDKYFPESGWRIVKKNGFPYHAVMGIKTRVRDKKVRRVYVLHVVKKNGANKYGVYTRYNQVGSHCKRQCFLLRGCGELETLEACVQKFESKFYQRTLGIWHPRALEDYTDRSDQGKWTWIPLPGQQSKRKSKRIRRSCRGSESDTESGSSSESDSESDSEGSDEDSCESHSSESEIESGSDPKSSDDDVDDDCDTNESEDECETDPDNSDDDDSEDSDFDK